jgi:hypothetical protein
MIVVLVPDGLLRDPQILHMLGNCKPYDPNIIGQLSGGISFFRLSNLYNVQCCDFLASYIQTNT